MKKLNYGCLLVCILGMFCFPTSLIKAENTKTSTSPPSTKIISAVYDDSGSMYWAGTKCWAQTNYALQQLAAGLQQQDSLYVTYMSSPQTSWNATGSSDDRQQVVDNIKKRTEIANQSPMETIDTAWQKLYNSKSKQEDSEYWLLIYANGTFSKPYTNTPVAQADFENKIKELQARSMPDGKKVHIAYIAIGPESFQLQSDEEHYLYVYTCEREEAYPKSFEVSHMINEEYQFTDEEIEFIDDYTMDVKTAYPLYELNLYQFQGDVSIQSDAKEAVPITTKSHISYPELENYQTDTSLLSEVVKAGYTDEIMPAGTYRLTFSNKINKEEIAMYGKLAIQIELDIKDAQTNQSTEIEKLQEKQPLTIQAKVLTADTSTPFALPADTDYTLRYESGESIQKSETGEMQLTDINLTREQGYVDVQIQIGDHATLRRGLVLQPIPTYSYTMKPVNSEVQGNHDTMALDTAILLQVYKDGEILQDIEEIRDLPLTFAWSKEDALLWLDVVYQHDGTILCKPKYGISQLPTSFTQWLSSWMLTPDKNELTITLHTDTIATAKVQVDFGEGNTTAYMLHICFPFLILFLLLGYFIKPRFPRGMTVRYISVIEEEEEYNSYFQSWENVPLAERHPYPSTWRSWIPFLPNAVRVNNLLFTACYTKRKQQLKVKLKQDGKVYRLLHVDDFSTHDSITFSKKEKEQEELQQGLFYLTYQQGLLIEMSKDSYLLYKFVPCAKQHTRKEEGEIS